MKELTERQRKVINGFDPMKPVFFRYDVVDCEHDGDMRSAENEVRRYVNQFGGEVTDTYWDGEDCGDAYIECRIPFGSLEQVLTDGFFDWKPWQ